MTLRRSQLLARADVRPVEPVAAPDAVNVNAPLQRLAELYLEQIKTKPVRRFGKRAGDLALKTVKELGKDPEPQMSALKEHWGEIVGSGFSTRSAPMKLSRAKDGLTLILRVEGAAAPMIQHQMGQILTRVNLYAGPPGIKALKIEQGPLPKKPAAKAPAARLVPLNASQEAEIEQLLANVDDEKLKASLRRLGRGVYARSSQKAR